MGTVWVSSSGHALALSQVPQQREQIIIKISIYGQIQMTLVNPFHVAAVRISTCPTLKGTVHQIMKIRSLSTHPHVDRKSQKDSIVEFVSPTKDAATEN